MSIEDAIMGGIVFRGKKDKPKEDGKVKTKAKKKFVYYRETWFRCCQDEADIRKKRAGRHK